jgi:hypothetical protein
MTLAAGEQRRLARIERALRRSDPKLTAMLSMFNRLTRSEAMPRREFLPEPGWLRRLSARPVRSARPDRPVWAARSTRPIWSARPVRPARPARPARPVRPARRGWPSRLVAILPLIMAMCVLGLVVVLFSALSHVGSGSATHGPAVSCHSVMLAGCRSRAPAPLK